MSEINGVKRPNEWLFSMSKWVNRRAIPSFSFLSLSLSLFFVLCVAERNQIEPIPIPIPNSKYRNGKETNGKYKIQCKEQEEIEQLFGDNFFSSWLQQTKYLLRIQK